MLSFADAIFAIRKSVYGRDNRFPIRDALLDTMLVTKTIDQNYKDLEARIAELESKVPSDNEPPVKDFITSFFDSEKYVIGEDLWADQFGGPSIHMHNTDNIVKDPDRTSWILFKDISESRLRPSGIWNSYAYGDYNPEAEVYTAYIVASSVYAYNNKSTTLFGVGHFQTFVGQIYSKYKSASFDSVLGLINSSGSIVTPSDSSEYVNTKEPHVYCLSIRESQTNSNNYDISIYSDGKFYLSLSVEKRYIYNKQMAIHSGCTINSSNGDVTETGTSGQISVRAALFYNSVHTDDEIKTMSEWLTANYINT